MTYTTIRELHDFLHLAPQDEAALEKLLDEYPMRIPEYYLDLIDFSDPNDPIRMMSVPSLDETDRDGSFDTSGEQSNTRLPGMQHKYSETVMILSTNQCAMYCRHCFRKRLVGLGSEEIAAYLDEIAAYVREHTEITNVLISGGDSLMNPTPLIRRYLELFTAIDHLDFIRFGSRIPVVLPERISGDAGLLGVFEEFGRKKHICLVSQFNHPRELTPQAVKALGQLRGRGITLRNQTVLLRGVNDDPHVMAELMRKLTATSVSPYYVFQCRPVTGVKNRFQVPIRDGIKIVEGAKAMQNGFGKSFKYCMSHVTGKIELLGDMNGEVVMKYHEAKNRADLGKVFSLKLDGAQCWLPDDFHL